MKYLGKRTLIKCNHPITANVMASAVQLLGHVANTVLLMLKSWLLIAYQIREICYNNDKVRNYPIICELQAKVFTRSFEKETCYSSVGLDEKLMIKENVCLEETLFIICGKSG